MVFMSLCLFICVCVFVCLLSCVFLGIRAVFVGVLVFVLLSALFVYPKTVVCLLVLIFVPLASCSLSCLCDLVWPSFRAKIFGGSSDEVSLGFGTLLYLVAPARLVSLLVGVACLVGRLILVAWQVGVVSMLQTVLLWFLAFCCYTLS